MKKTLILDEATWRCGKNSQNSNNRRGTGDTRLENEEGFMCCLGQFSNQLKKGLNIRCKMFPAGTNEKIPLLTKRGYNSYVDTKLSNKAVVINDDESTSIYEKVRKLRSLFRTKGIKIVFKRIKNASKSNKK